MADTPDDPERSFQPSFSSLSIPYLYIIRVIYILYACEAEEGCPSGWTAPGARPRDCLYISVIFSHLHGLLVVVALVEGHAAGVDVILFTNFSSEREI